MTSYEKNGIKICITDLPPRKKPGLVVQIDNCIYKVASFDDETSANWFAEILEEMFSEVRSDACVSQIPPAQQWVPCSERLPEDGRPVLIYAWNVHHVVARYDSFRTENGYKKCWVTADAWNGNTEIEHNVIAWMPLPEPYKGDMRGEDYENS